MDERVKRYLEATPPAVSGQRGHDTTYAMLCRLFEVFPEVRARDDDALLAILAPWNACCSPPWAESELRHKIADARRKTETETRTTTGTLTIVPASNADVRATLDAPTDSETETEAEEWPTLDAAALHGLAGEFVGTVEPHSEADPVALLVSFLVAFGSLAGRNAYVRAGGDRHYANEFACLVGALSRARKGTSLGYILDAFDGVDEAWTKRRVNGLSSGEGVIAAVAGNVEADDDGAITIPDTRLWVVESEFGNVLRVLRREGNTLSGILRQAWDGVRSAC